MAIDKHKSSTANCYPVKWAGAAPGCTCDVMKSPTPRASLADESGPSVDAIWRRHHQALLERARFLLRSNEAADDLVQDVFERALRENRRKIPPAKMRGWLMVILYNAFIDGCRTVARRRRILRHTEAIRLALAPPAEAEHPWMSIDRAVVEASIPDLPGTLRVPLELRLNGASYREISARLQLNDMTVATRIHRAHRALRPLVARRAGISLTDEAATPS